MKQTRYPTIYTPSQNEGWASPINITAEDGIYSTAVSGYGHSVATIFSGFDFDIPVSAEIISIKVETLYKLNYGGSVPQLIYSDIMNGDRRIMMYLYDVPSVDTFASLNPIHNYTIEQLNAGDFEIEILAQHNVSDRTFYVDYLRIVVEYNAPQIGQVQII